MFDSVTAPQAIALAQTWTATIGNNPDRFLFIPIVGPTGMSYVKVGGVNASLLGIVATGSYTCSVYGFPNPPVGSVSIEVQLTGVGFEQNVAFAVSYYSLPQSTSLGNSVSQDLGSTDHPVINLTVNPSQTLFAAFVTGDVSTSDNPEVPDVGTTIRQDSHLFAGSPLQGLVWADSNGAVSGGQSLGFIGHVGSITRGAFAFTLGGGFIPQVIII